MKNRVRVVSAFVVLLVVPSTALADDQAITKAAEKLLGFGHAVAEMKSKGTEVARHGFLDPAPSTCTAALAEAEKAGATDGTRLYASWPDSLPSYKYERSIGSSITLEAARGVCTDYAVWKPAVKAAVSVQTAQAYLQNLESGGLGSYAIEEGKTCLAAIEGLDAASRQVAVKIGDATMTLDDGRALCQQLVDKGGKAGAQEAAAAGEKRAEIEAKWKKVGMKGDRLKLFVDNELDGGGFPWYAKGCTTEITDPKKLARAKILFMWTAGPNGGTLVSKYAFKGNKVKETAREYFDDAKAYRGCK
jgi:hypothetical protein